MTVATPEEGESSPPALFRLSPAVSADRMLANMRHAISLGLPLATPCKAHGFTLSVAGGGPSLADTYRELDGAIAAINGSLRFLLEREIKPGASYMCGVMDAGAHMADIIVADPKVRYYVASVCDPAVFEKLRGCDVRLWHVSPESTEDPEAVTALLDASYPEWHAIGGGCTMGLRWLTLGYFLGFRKFELHGLDSSFREGTHAYPDRADTKDRISFAGRMTRPNFLAQVYDFFGTLNRLYDVDHEPIGIKVHGDGLLQDEYKHWLERQPEPMPTFACVKTGDKYGPEYVLNLRDGIARHFKHPHRFVCFTEKPVEGVKCYPLPLNAPGWWAKIGLFRLKKPMTYIDLDVVVTGDLSPLVDWQGFGIMQDPLWPMYGSAIMKLSGNERHIYDEFVRMPFDAMRSCPAGDQQFITRHIGEAKTFPKSWFPSFKLDACADGFPEGAIAINFHGRPKPHECGGWVAEHWNGEKAPQKEFA